jgi:NADH-quinone oxidoreductase subunit E
VDYCAAKLSLTKTEVTGVVSFYTMYKRELAGEYSVGVCTNALCAVLGGDEIYADLKEHLGIEGEDHHGAAPTTPDGKVTLERIECNAACDYAPVVMVNWEFFDNQTPQSAKQLVDDLRAGQPVRPTRGPSRLCTWREASRILAGFNDDQATDGPAAGPADLVGLKIAKEHGWTAPHPARDADGSAGNGGAPKGGAAKAGAAKAGASKAGADSSAGAEPPGSSASPADSSSPVPSKSPEPGQPPKADQAPPEQESP